MLRESSKRVSFCPPGQVGELSFCCLQQDPQGVSDLSDQNNTLPPIRKLEGRLPQRDMTVVRMICKRIGNPIVLEPSVLQPFVYHKLQHNCLQAGNRLNLQRRPTSKGQAAVQHSRPSPRLARKGWRCCLPRSEKRDRRPLGLS